MKMPRRPRAKVRVPLTSIGDIAFLLIIFFLVTSNFVKEAQIKNIEEARSIDIDDMEAARVSVVVDGDGELWLQGKPCHVEMLESAVSAMLDGREDKLVMLRIDRRLTQDVYGDVFMALSDVGAEIALVGEKEE